MAGISHAVLIIEGRKNSGTLLTAGYAAEFGRDIMAVPGSIFDETSFGPHKLIHDGAAIIHSSLDILDALGFNTEREHDAEHQLSLVFETLSADERKVIAALQFAPSSTTEIIDRLSMTAMELSSILSRLEIQGIVKESAGVYRVGG